MDLEDLVARYATGAAGVALFVAMSVGAAMTPDATFRRELRGARRYLLLFLVTAFLRFLLPDRRWLRLDKALYVVGLVLFAWAAIRGAASAWSRYHRRRTGAETPRILRDLVDGLLFCVAALIILQSTLGLDPSPLLASSAVISLVLGLALQDTLGNLFAGLSLQVEQPYAAGDWVRVGAHQGQVLEVGWRATRLRTGAGEALNIPNSVVAKEAVYNLSRHALLRKVVVSAGYDVPPNAVKEAAREVLRGLPGVMADPAPAVRTADLTATGVQYEVIFWVSRFEQGGAAEDELRTQLWYGLHRAGIALSALGTEVRLARGARAAGVTDVDVPALLAQAKLLAGVDPGLREALTAHARVVRFGAGERIARQGDAAPGPLCVIAEGEVALVVRDAGGQEHEVERLSGGDVFGEMGVLAGEARVATVVATRDTAVVALDREAFDELFRRAPDAAHRLAEVMATRREALARSIERVAPGQAPPAEPPHQLAERLKEIFKHLG